MNKKVFILCLILFTLISIFFMSGCAKQTSSSTQESPTEKDQITMTTEINSNDEVTSLEIKEITISGTEYRTYNEGTQFDVFCDNEFSVEIKLSEKISEETCKQYMDKYSTENFRIVFREDSISVYVQSVEAGDEYSINLDASLISTLGHSVKNPISIIFNVEDIIKVDYIPHYDNGCTDYFDPAFLGMGYEYTMVTPDELELKFSSSVNRIKVENAIKRCISSDLALYKTRWNNNSLFLDFDKIICDKLHININDFLDKDDQKFESEINLIFTPPTTIYSYDMITGAINKEYEFGNEICDVLRNDYYGKYLLATDEDHSYVLNLETKNIKPIPPYVHVQSYLGMSDFEAEIVWLNESTILYYEPDRKTFSTYDFDTDLVKTCFQVERTIHYYSVSPNGEYIAVAISDEKAVYSEKPDLEIKVYTLDGLLVYETGKLLNEDHIYLMGGLTFNINLDWYDSEILLYDLGDEEGNTSIVATNVLSGETETRIQSGHLIQTEQGVMFTQDLIHQRYGRKVSFNYNNSTQKLNNVRLCNIVDSEHIFIKRYQSETSYELDPKIYLYNYETNQVKDIGLNAERVIGYSLENKKIYFLSNSYHFIIYM